MNKITYAIIALVLFGIFALTYFFNSQETSRETVIVDPLAKPIIIKAPDTSDSLRISKFLAEQHTSSSGDQISQQSATELKESLAIAVSNRETA